MHLLFGAANIPRHRIRTYHRLHSMYDAGAYKAESSLPRDNNLPTRACEVAKPYTVTWISSFRARTAQYDHEARSPPQF